MTCPLCGRRKARRACPALGEDICAVCCGTKRLTEIRCPADCGYLAASKEHPPAIAVRQRQQDVGLLYRALREFDDPRSQLFLLLATFLHQHRPDDLQRMVDQDVAEAADALASTLETSARGVIYDHRPASLPAQRLVEALKPLIVKAGGTGGAAFERDAASVLRRLAETARDASVLDPGSGRAFLDWLGRILRESEASNEPPPAEEGPRLIVP